MKNRETRIQQLKDVLVASLQEVKQLDVRSSELQEKNKALIVTLPEHQEQLAVQLRIERITSVIQRLERKRRSEGLEKLKKKRRRLKRLKRRHEKLHTLILQAVQNSESGREAAEIDKKTLTIEKMARKVRRKLHGLNADFDEDAHEE